MRALSTLLLLFFLGGTVPASAQSLPDCLPGGGFITGTDGTVCGAYSVPALSYGEPFLSACPGECLGTMTLTCSKENGLPTIKTGHNCKFGSSGGPCPEQTVPLLVGTGTVDVPELMHREVYSVDCPLGYLGPPGGGG